MNKEKAVEDVAREVGQHAENIPWGECTKNEQEAARRSAEFILKLPSVRAYFFSEWEEATKKAEQAIIEYYTKEVQQAREKVLGEVYETLKPWTTHCKCDAQGNNWSLEHIYLNKIYKWWESLKK